MVVVLVVAWYGSGGVIGVVWWTAVEDGGTSSTVSSRPLAVLVEHSVVRHRRGVRGQVEAALGQGSAERVRRNVVRSRHGRRPGAPIR